MPAGFNIKVRVWDMKNNPDDRVGGAVITGSILYDQLDARLHPDPPNDLLLQQGIEVEYIWNIYLRPATLVLEERDEIEVVHPSNHPEYGKRFRVKGIQRTGYHPDDSRGMCFIKASKVKYGHR
jgi:hypothetical protein